jgi:hypothetical protein
MRVFAACILALGLAVTPAMAGTGNATDKDSAAGGTSAAANTSSSAAPAAAPAAKAGEQPAASSQLESELQELRTLLESQSKQSQELKDQIQQQKEQMQLLEEELTEAKNPAPADPNATAEPAAGIGPSVAVANAVAAAKGAEQNPDEPVSIKFKGVTLTPGGFFAAETVWRQKALASDVNTPFNSIPFNGSPNAHMDEWQASGRQSRISMLVQGQLSSVKLSGYYETDFLSAGTTSTPTESNSYTMRQRQFWGQAAFNDGLTFTGGQMWSLVTETTHGMDNRTEALPMTIDAQYNVGFSWARQFGARFTYNWNNKVWLGFSIEQSTPTVTVHGNPTAQVAAPTLACTTPGVNNCSATGTYTLPVNLNPTFVNFLLGSFGTSGGLYNPLGNYGYNDAPDFVVKAVFEPGFGHYEIFGLIGEVHDRIFPCVPITGTVAPAGCSSITSAQFAGNQSATTGGVGANARWNLLAKKVDLGVHFLGGTGIGRYGSGTLADLTVRPDGTPVPIHNFQSLGTLQLHPTPKLDIYMNVGGEYEERTDYTKTGGSAPNEGYGYASLNNSGCWNETLPLTGVSTSTNLGVPTGVGGTTGFIPGPLGSCTGDTRRLIEGTFGFWYRFYKGTRGTFQYGMQYSNVYRDTWRGTAGTIVSTGLPNNGQPHSDENMILTSVRYYIP